MIIRLESPHRVAFFTDVEMVALLTENAEGADDFIQRTSETSSRPARL